jgi:hypothetical protein
MKNVNIDFLWFEIWIGPILSDLGNFNKKNCVPVPRRELSVRCFLLVSYKGRR